MKKNQQQLTIIFDTKIDSILIKKMDKINLNIIRLECYNCYNEES